MDSLKFACSWSSSVSGARIGVKIGKLQLEGCSFDGSRLSENMRDSPSISEIPPCVVAWIPKVTIARCCQCFSDSVITETFRCVICLMPPDTRNICVFVCHSVT